MDRPFQLSVPGSSLSIDEKEHVRSLFWTCYVLDKEISLRTGNPPLLVDKYCDLTSPPSNFEHDTAVANPREFTEEKRHLSIQYILHSLGNIQLSKLKEHVFELLFSARALNESDSQTLVNIRQLDDEVERWRLSIPLHLRPVLSEPQNDNGGADDQRTALNLLRVLLQLEYNRLVTIIHTTVRKCTTDASDGVRDLHDVAHSSFDLSLVASRSTLRCLRDLANASEDQAFQ